MGREKTSFYRVASLPDLLVFQAEYRNFQFDRHFHDDFALGLMESGVQKIYCRGRDFFASAGSLITVNPGEIHDGCSADGSGYIYRILYIPHELVQEAGSPDGKREVVFTDPVTRDPVFAARLSRLFSLLDKEDILEVETAFYSLLITFLARHGSEKMQLPGKQVFSDPVFKTCEYINDNAIENLSLDDIAAVAGLSRFHFLRVFKKSTGMSPYAYLLHRRLQLAKEGIRRRKSLADAAIDAGFSDQSHLSRRFKAAYGITLNQYRKAVC
jgi:AraC-like DNA-binding protein